MNLITKKTYFIVLLILIFRIDLSAQSQNPYGVQIEAGSTSILLEDVTDIFDNQVLQIRRFDVPVEVQRSFSAGRTFGGSFFYHISDSYRIKLKIYSTSTDAYCLYGDYSGTLDLVGKVEADFYMLSLSKLFDNQKAISPYIEIGAGISSGSFTLQQVINLNSDIHKEREESNITVYGEAVLIEPGVGFRYHLNRFEISLRGGYRKSIIKDPSINFTINEEAAGIAKPQIELDLSGFLLQAGVAVRF